MSIVPIFVLPIFSPKFHRRARFACLFLVWVWGISVASARPQPSEDPGGEFFEREIRPLLVEKCYSCHSSEAKKLKGGLLLDSRAGWMQGGDSGPAILPGQPEKSRLIEAVRYDNSDLAMPPEGKLPRPAIEALERWVEMGAPDPREAAAALAARKSGPGVEEGRAFWSYRLPVKLQPPAVEDTDWPRSAIDRFLLAPMEARGIRPVGDADRASLARRIYFDLTGLPPGPAELDRFLADERADALTRWIDELLASPHFGERWGRHWLDVARFAESVVLRGLVLRHAWRYRDFVIDAFNDDMPFDQFIRENLAGDLLPGGELADRQRRLVATTFLTLGDYTLESQDKKQLDMDVVDEQLDVIGKAFLAQTIACARCHDHKFDPIPTRDYYALAGILRGVDTLAHANVSGWVERPLPLSEEDERAHRRHASRVTALEEEIRSARRRLAALKTGEEAEPAIVAAKDLGGIVIDDSGARAVGEWKHSRWTRRYIGDGYLHDLGEGKGSKSLSFVPELPRPGFYEVRFAYTPGGNRSTNVPVTVVGPDGEKTVIVNEKLDPPVEGRWVRLGRFRFEAGEDALVRVDTTRSTETVTADAVQFLSLEEAGAAEAGELARATRSAERSETASGKEQERESTRRALAAELEALESRLETVQAKAPPRPMVLSVKESQPGDIPIHVRGSVHNLGPVVPRGFLRVTMGSEEPRMPEDQSGRLELAQWIASPRNPLTARVVVNRVWHWLFGAGIVRSPDNFGTTGQRPTHPDLLDWLALRFIEEGWSVKWLVREIVSSRAYRMASRVPVGSAAMALDPQNRLLWRRERRQLEAECIRDAMLSISGRLKLDMGGPGFPAGLKSDYGFDHGEPRRSVYVPVFRNALPEIFEVFDGAHPSMVTGKRDASTVAPQALFLLNHPFVQAQAKAAARRLAEDGPLDLASGVSRAYTLVLGRPPTARELELACKHLSREEREEGWAQLLHVLFNSLDFRYLH